MERRKADDEAFARRLAKETNERESEDALREIEREHFDGESGETYVVIERKYTMASRAFVSERKVEVVDAARTAKPIVDTDDTMTPMTWKTLLTQYDAELGEVRVEMLVNGMFPTIWKRRRARGERNVVAQELGEWLWGVVLHDESRDVACAARDALLFALGFDTRIGSLYTSGLRRFDYARREVYANYDAPAWTPTAKEVCDALVALGARDDREGAKNSSDPPPEPEGNVRVRHELFLVLQVITAFCDNAFARGKVAFEGGQGEHARLLQILASIAIDPRTRALDVVVEQTAAALMASIPDKQWMIFKAQAVKRLAALMDDDEYGVKVYVARWLPCATDREVDLRDAISAGLIMTLQHHIARADGKKLTPIKLTDKLASEIAQSDAASILKRRSAAAAQLADARVDAKLDPPEVWRLIYVMDLVDIVLNGGVVIEGEELSPEGGLELFMRFLSKKLPRTFRPSLSALKTKMWAVKTRYERIGDVTRAAIKGAKEAMHQVE